MPQSMGMTNDGRFRLGSWYVTLVAWIKGFQVTRAQPYMHETRCLVSAGYSLLDAEDHCLSCFLTGQLERGGSGRDTSSQRFFMIFIK